MHACVWCCVAWEYFDTVYCYGMQHGIVHMYMVLCICIWYCAYVYGIVHMYMVLCIIYVYGIVHMYMVLCICIWYCAFVHR